jgi:hypothetical protein
VSQRSRRKSRDSGRLVGDDRVFPLVALARQRHETGGRVEGRDVLNRGDDGLARCLVVARLVAQRQSGPEIVLDTRRV